MTSSKLCNGCDEVKDVSAFNKCKRDGYKSKCKECRKKYRAENKSKISASKSLHYQDKKDHYKDYQKNYRNTFPEVVKERKKRYFQKSKFDINTKIKTRKIVDLLFKFSCNVRTLITGSFRRTKDSKYKKQTKTLQLLGCSITELRAHLTKQFLPGMSLDNYGEWHIDHIVPLAYAQTQQDIERLCHYTNLQPLWAKDNLKKGARNANT